MWSEYISDLTNIVPTFKVAMDFYCILFNSTTSWQIRLSIRPRIQSYVSDDRPGRRFLKWDTHTHKQGRMKTLLLVVFLTLQDALTKSPPHSIYILQRFKTKQKKTCTSYSVCGVTASLGAAELVVLGLCHVIEDPPTWFPWTMSLHVEYGR